jgi:hypothetical protein
MYHSPRSSLSYETFSFATGKNKIRNILSVNSFPAFSDAFYGTHLFFHVLLFFSSSPANIFHAQKILQLSIGCDMFSFFVDVQKKEKFLCEFEMKGAMLFLGEKKNTEKSISIL